MIVVLNGIDVLLFKKIIIIVRDYKLLLLYEKLIENRFVCE